MEPTYYTSDQWKRVCALSSQLLDSPTADWEGILARECGEDPELRTRVLSVCGSYSETDELFGLVLNSPLALADSLIGQRIGPWEILRLLGEGGMGWVYLAKRADGVFTQYAAFKLSREQADPGSVRRFHAERQILAMLEHPSIARAIDGGATSAGAPYLVMEYVEGGLPIDEFQPGNPVRDKIRLFLQVVEAVAAAHRHQVAHLDLKPSNILVTPDGLAKVLDFGLAKLIREERPPAVQTNAGHSALTPAYGSPEQLLREPCTLSSDIYSLGAVLYKMLTGLPPHDLTGLNISQSIRMVAESDPAPVSSYARGVDADVDAIVLKALDHSPARRYSSATEFAADLRRYLEGFPVEAREGALRNRASLFIRRHRGGALAAAGCLLLLSVVGAKTIRDWRVEGQQLEQMRNAARTVISGYQGRMTKLGGSTQLRNRITDGIYAAQSEIKVGSSVNLMSNYGNPNGATFLDTKGDVMSIPRFWQVPTEGRFVMTAESPTRDKGSGSWQIVSATGKINGSTLVYGDPIHLKNIYPGGGYLDNCGWIADLKHYQGYADRGAVFAVFTAQSKDRDNGTGTWIVLSADSKSAGSAVLEKDRILLQNTFAGPWREGSGSPRPTFLDASDQLPPLVPEFKISGHGLQVFLSDKPKGHNNSTVWSILFSNSDAESSETLEAMATPKSLEVKTNTKEGLPDAYVPAGGFRMGCSDGDADCLANGKPAPDVSITKGSGSGRRK